MTGSPHPERHRASGSPIRHAPSSAISRNSLGPGPRCAADACSVSGCSSSQARHRRSGAPAATPRKPPLAVAASDGTGTLAGFPTPSRSERRRDLRPLTARHLVFAQHSPSVGSALRTLRFPSHT